MNAWTIYFKRSDGLEGHWGRIADANHAEATPILATESEALAWINKNPREGYSFTPVEIPLVLEKS